MADVDDDRNADDYEYDEAHDAPEAAAGPGADPAAQLRAPDGMHVTDDAGDYSYDAAHDRA
jgi:hypothetical protein